MRLSGSQAIPIGSKVFSNAGRHGFGERLRYVEYGQILSSDGQPIDTGLAWCFRGPASFTGEDTVEISAHGSMLILEQIVESAVSFGAVLAQPGEFTRRAFLNGKIDLLQAEAVVDLIQAGSKQGLANAFGLANGRLSTRIDEIKSSIVHALALVEAQLDFSEEDLGSIPLDQILEQTDSACAATQLLVDSYNSAKRRQDGVLIALVGPPNAGKSTLFNALLDEDRAIVTHIPGTTRDLIEGRVVWRGELVRIVDTAGIRQADDFIENQGIKRSRQVLLDADLVVLVVDQSADLSLEVQELLLDLEEKPFVIALNKMDLPTQISRSHFSMQQNIVDLCASRGNGLDQLKDLILATLPQEPVDSGLAIYRERHHTLGQSLCQTLNSVKEMLNSEALPECIADELRFALGLTGEMLGIDIREEVLDRIFSDFCIGK